MNMSVFLQYDACGLNETTDIQDLVACKEWKKTKGTLETSHAKSCCHTTPAAYCAADRSIEIAFDVTLMALGAFLIYADVLAKQAPNVSPRLRCREAKESDDNT